MAITVGLAGHDYDLNAGRDTMNLAPEVPSGLEVKRRSLSEEDLQCEQERAMWVAILILLTLVAVSFWVLWTKANY